MYLHWARLKAVMTDVSNLVRSHVLSKLVCQNILEGLHMDEAMSLWTYFLCSCPSFFKVFYESLSV